MRGVQGVADLRARSVALPHHQRRERKGSQICDHDPALLAAPGEARLPPPRADPAPAESCAAAAAADSDHTPGGVASPSGCSMRGRATLVSLPPTQAPHRCAAAPGRREATHLAAAGPCAAARSGGAAREPPDPRQGTRRLSEWRGPWPSADGQYRRRYSFFRLYPKINSKFSKIFGNF